jgi:4-alpha-glucanotransferase
MDGLKERAARWGIETEYWDGLGRRRDVEPGTLLRLLDILNASGTPPMPPASRLASPPAHAYQGVGAAARRFWALAVQLYGVRSRHNWGHGNFTDLTHLIELASRLGAAGIGLNPLHAIFEDRPDEFSPYSPSSRLFLNTHYIDPEAIPECPTAAATGVAEAVAQARTSMLLDYANVIAAQARAFGLAYEAFLHRGTGQRKQAFAEFRRDGGSLLLRFSSFEFLRRRFASPWWTWPQEWRAPNDKRLAALHASEEVAIGYYEFLQWVADTQLRACGERAEALQLPIGLYLDIAVGTRSDGFDAWNDQAVVERALEIGAPPDPLSLEGQRWGLAGVNPIALEAENCEPFRRVLRASMRYAGAIRLDHVMGLQRLYMIPEGMRADQGAYVQFPFDRMLMIAADESAANRCIVIGEDLGTVGENFRERIAAAGIWSYQVMLFQRAADGGFIAPSLYRENALVTFGTHDVPTFAGWKTGHDLNVKRALGLDPGETADERKAAEDAMARTLAWRGFPTLDYPDVIAFLASTPSRLLMVSVEDALGLIDQVNVPGTVAEHPNWRRKVPIDLEDLEDQPMLKNLCKIFAAAGRRA